MTFAANGAFVQGSHSYLKRFGEPGHTALRALIDAEEPPDALDEREALFALARLHRR